MTVAGIWMRFHAMDDQRDQIIALLRQEHAVHKERGDRLMELVRYAYQRSSDALMSPPTKPREARQARDQALSDINKKLGWAVR